MARRSEKRTLGLARRLSALASEAADVDSALLAALDEICTFTGWPVGHVLLARRGEVVGTAVWHGARGRAFERFRREGDELHLPVGEGLAGEVLATGRTAAAPDIACDPRFVRRDAALEAGIRRAVAFPLVAGGEVIGVLELFGLEPGDPGEGLLATLGVACPEVGRIVERGRAAERLLASEQRYRLLFECATDAILVGDPEGVIAAANPAACRLFGFPESELRGMGISSLVAPEWQEVVAAHVTRKSRGAEEDAAYEMVMLDRAGARIPVEVRSSTLREGGDVVGIQAVVRDIRGRRRSEAALRESEERFRAAFDGAPVGMALCSLDGRWLKVNETLCAMLGHERGELLATGWEDVTHPDDRDADRELAARLARGEIPSYRVDKRYLRSDGGVVRARLGVSLVRAEDGSPAYAVAQMVELDAAPRVDGPCPLSPREREVLSLLAAGLRSSEAAARLGIGEETVQTHVRRAMAKASAVTRAHAVAIALDRGWVRAAA